MGGSRVAVLCAKTLSPGRRQGMVDRWSSFLVTPDLDKNQMRDPEAMVCSAPM